MLDFGRTLILPIPPDRWVPPCAPATVDGVQLAPKSELHITLIGRRLGDELHAQFDSTYLDSAIAAARDAHDWRFGRTGRHLLLRKPIAGDRLAHSLIEMIDLPAMAPFHGALGRMLGRQLQVPPAHVTLYTAGDPRGIGVSSPGRLRALAVREVGIGQLP